MSAHRITVTDRRIKQYEDSSQAWPDLLKAFKDAPGLSMFTDKALSALVNIALEAISEEVPEEVKVPEGKAYNSFDELAIMVRARAMEARHVNSDLRMGQALFNALYDIKPKLANKIRGTFADPHYLDGRVPEFWVAVRDNFMEVEI
jgi:hypothetical protein